MRPTTPPNRNRRDSRPDPRQPKPVAKAPLVPLSEIMAGVEKALAGLAAKPFKQALREVWRAEDQRQGTRPDYLLYRSLICREAQPEKRPDLVATALVALRARTPCIQWSGLWLGLPLLLSDTGDSRDGLPGVASSLRLRTEQKAELLKAYAELLARIGQPLPECPQSSALAKWSASVAIDIAQTSLSADSAAQHLDSLQALLTSASPEWKPQRDASLTFIADERFFLEPIGAVLRVVLALLNRVLRALTSAAQAAGYEEQTHAQLAEVAQWRYVAWRWLVVARGLVEPNAKPSALELLIGLSARTALPKRSYEQRSLVLASQEARLAGDVDEATRLAALAFAAYPTAASTSHGKHQEKAAEPPNRQLLQPLAWSLAEAGLELPRGYAVKLDELPFPGESPQSPAGEEAARQFADPADVSRARLLAEVAVSPDWATVREAGVALHHPLAALAWVARKAQSFAMKKGPTVLEAATRLALRHGCLSTAGRLLRELPSVSLVLDYAKAMRESLRRMPLLRETAAWESWAACLRQAWGRLEADAIADAETLFLLHETLFDRPTTALRSLPQQLRVLALRHPHSRRHPTRLAQALVAEPNLLRSLEHQRALEHWALAQDAKTRPELARLAWVSLVTRGDPAAGKTSLLALGPQGQLARRDKLNLSRDASETQRQEALASLVAQALASIAPEAEWVLLAVSGDLTALPWARLLQQAQCSALPSLVPSWEWASRVLRDTRTESERHAEVLGLGLATATPPNLLASAEALALRLPQACVLLADHAAHAASKWSSLAIKTPLANVEEADDDEAPAATDAETEADDDETPASPVVLESPAPAPAASTAPQPSHQRPRRSTHIGGHPKVISQAPCGDLVPLCLAQNARWFIEARAALPTEAALALHQALAHSPAAFREALLAQPALAEVVVHGLPPGLG